ncbi:hypothetical protein D9619_006575 [Psilocybe cf. subviscida]|uniref:TEA domain-containing protein n=1 Tax=Psilocybe cf. subviscida TaxID=2480587 RepID=A0A8H5EXW1_9AGAR|nr:hypothetical protein D9619_006575 [Psilocybe cf. subviscida]
MIDVPTITLDEQSTFTEWGSHLKAGHLEIYRTRQHPSALVVFSKPLDLSARTGRKSTKYKRGAEAVWPPRVEGALLEGLEQYFPPPTSSSSRHQRKFQRFPQRNKIISKHILNNTGVYRTAKQVGSRLQQLSETSTDAYILYLIKDKNFGPNRRCLSPSFSSRTTRSLRSSPSSTDISDYDYDFSAPSVTPSGVSASMEQQQEDAITLWRDMQAQQQQASMNLVWEQTSNALQEPTSEYQYQPEVPSTSVLGAPFVLQELSVFDSHQLTYSTPMIDVSNECGSFFTTPEYNVSFGGYNAQPFVYENVSPLADVDSPLYAFSADMFTILEAVPNDAYPTLHLPQPRL